MNLQRRLIARGIVKPVCRVALLLLLFCATLLRTYAQEEKNDYVWPTDSLVLQKLHHWQGEKFGLLMHWGTYSEWGIVESWSLCPEDEGWTQRKGPYADNYFAYKKAYENLQTTFNPTDFNPDKWAKAAKDAGMKYVVFTTKHHDGFCMFDTKQTDYKVTSSKTPFSSNPKANIAKEVFNSFRKEGLMIGAYFSKPDWNTPYYWWPYFPPKDRNVNYDPAKYPKKWNQFKTFTYNQIKELMTGYGSVDILWLDGGWVRPHTLEEQKENHVYNQDIDMPKIAAMARKYQPGILVVDRAVGGPYENYQTPEQQVPDKPLDHPWETCMTMGNSWSYVPDDHYKPTNTLIHLLIRIVSRGGNFLLNIGPSPKGDWSDTAYARLKEIGSWMKVNGSAIYDSRPVAPYAKDNLVFTQSEDGKSTYIFILSEDKQTGGELQVPESITLPEGLVSSRSKISVMGYPSWKIKLNADTHTLQIRQKGKSAVRYALVLKVTGDA
ncbi:alpha-L-fucosidase [Arachidicoccus terrestris]|uniref:alpha-L-fucosidase n=1 Tax=Arachidicoccus terrestris TaxID=2875539 RepID=UPI001CC4165C|nr:alpha-L-fucosidase [Arachidicoccus terrestris]UAY56160.1 alpha-L-fucosidase [Arachidicoccus terrestris]